MKTQYNPYMRITAFIVVFAFIFTQADLGIAMPAPGRGHAHKAQNLRPTSENPDTAEAIGNALGKPAKAGAGGVQFYQPRAVRKKGRPGDVDAKTSSVDELYKMAMELIDGPETTLKREQFSELIHLTRVACNKVLNMVIPLDTKDRGRKRERKKIIDDIEKQLSSKSVGPHRHTRLREDLSRLIDLESQRLESGCFTKDNADKSIINAIALAGEMLEIVLWLKFEYDTDMAANQIKEAVALSSLSDFFDRTMNAHMFAYFPFLTQPSLREGSFDKWFNYDEKFEFSAERNIWLYNRLRKFIREKTVLRHIDKGYLDRWLGDVGDWQHSENWIMGFGLNIEGEGKAKKFWYNYARLADTVAMMDEFAAPDNPSNVNVIPEIFLGVDPALLGAVENGEFVNIVSMYPYGNTNMFTAIEQGAEFEKQGYNLMLCPFPGRAYDAVYGREVLQLKDALMYVSAERYKKLLIASAIDPSRAQKMADKVPAEGIMVAIKFKEPAETKLNGRTAYSDAAIAHGVFLHFTHPMRPSIDNLNIPLVQPIVYEGFTYLKGLIPDVLRNTEVAWPATFNREMEDTKRQEQQARKDLLRKLGREPNLAEIENEVKQGIRNKLWEFITKYQAVTEIIVKPEQESGCRGTALLPILSSGARRDGKLVFLGSARDADKDLKITRQAEAPQGLQNFEEVVNAIYNISQNDNVVVQGVIPSFVRKLFTQEYLQREVNCMAELGGPISLDKEPLTPLFSCFRFILSRGVKQEFETPPSHSIALLSTQPVGRGYISVYYDDIIAPRFRECLRRAMNAAYYGSMQARREYLRHAWPHILRRYLLGHPTFGSQVSDELNKFLEENFDTVVEQFFEENSKFVPERDRFVADLKGWQHKFLGQDEKEREFSVAIAQDFSDEIATAFNIFLGSFIEKAGLLDLDIHYSMDDGMPMYLGDEDENYLYIIKKDKHGKLMPDDWGNIQILPLRIGDKATDVKLYYDPQLKKEVPTRDGAGNALAVPIFEQRDDELVEREIYDENGNRISCLGGFILEFNPGSGMWRSYNAVLSDLDASRSGEGVKGIFFPLGERGRDFKKNTLHVESPARGAGAVEPTAVAGAAAAPVEGATQADGGIGRALARAEAGGAGMSGMPQTETGVMEAPAARHSVFVLTDTISADNEIRKKLRSRALDVYDHIDKIDSEILSGEYLTTDHISKISEKIKNIKADRIILYLTNPNLKTGLSGMRR